MKLNFSKIESLEKVLLFLFVLSCLILPAADVLISKKIIFLICLFVYVISLFFNSNKKIISFNSMFKLLLMTGITIIYSIPVYFTNEGNCMFIIVSLLTLFTIFLAYDYPSTLFNYLIVSSNILSLLTIFIAVLPSISKPLSIGVNMLFLNLDSGFLGERDFGGIKLIMVHFRTAPILIISFSHYFTQLIEQKKKFKNLLFFAINGSAIVFSASRGTMLFSFLSIFLISLFNIKNRKYRRFFYIFFILIFIGATYILKNTNIFSSKEESNSVKIGHIESFNEFTSDNPDVLIIGRGTGSSYYTEGFGRLAFQTEVTFLDMIRYWGILTAIVFIFLFSFPSVCFNKSKIIAFIMYFIDATTNPLIFNSTGMLVISIYFLLQDEFRRTSYNNMDKVIK